MSHDRVGLASAEDEELTITSNRSKVLCMQEFVVFFAGYSATCIEYRLVVR